jgi:threonylcarbamoyladenosine tRNA methylthiotransferase MtaB
VNRGPEELIGEVNELVSAGFEEVVLTGLNLGLYRSVSPETPVKDLAALTRLLLQHTDVRRIRLSSVEPQTVSDELIDLIAGSCGRVCRHLHMPLQSGSDRLLRLMRRPYTQAAYLECDGRIHNGVPGIVVGADVIVGFPGETEEDFGQTRRVVDSGLLDYLHVFRYSDRPGTTAAEMADKVDPKVARHRNETLVSSSRVLKAECNRRQVGRVLGVIAEHKKPSKGQFWGVADNYIRVKLPLDFGGGRKIVSYEVTTAYETHVEGRLLP